MNKLGKTQEKKDTLAVKNSTHAELEDVKIETNLQNPSIANVVCVVYLTSIVCLLRFIESHSLNLF